MANRITTLFDFKEQGSGLKKIKADVQGVDGAWNKAKAGFKSSINEFRSSNLAQGAAVAGLLAGANKAVKAASDLGESVNAVTVVYGENADAVLDIGENSAQSFGMSQRAFNEFATQFSAFANQIAENDGRAVSDVVQEMTTRVADFASVHNLSMEEAAQVAQSTLAGETEAFRRYGGDVSAATIKTYAYANGIAEAGSELTEGEKVLARYGAFMEQTADRAGDFANTSDSLANSQKILSAESENTAASVGESLAPAMAQLNEGLLVIIDSLDKIKVFDALSLGWVEDVGRTLGEVLSPWNRGAREANRAIEEAFNSAENAAKSFDMTLVEGKSTFGEVRAEALAYAEEVLGLKNATHFANLVALQWNDAQKEAADAAKEGADAALQNTEAMRDQSKAANNTADVMGELRRKSEEAERAQERADQAAEDYTQSLEDQRRKIEDLNNANLSALGTDIRLREAKRRTSDAYAEFTEVAKEAEVGTREYEEAADNALTAMLGQAEAATEYRIAQMEANGETVTAAEKAQIMEEELGNLALMLGPDSPLLANIQNYIDQLNNIPRNVSTTISVGGRTVSVGGGGGNVGGVGYSGTRASGGPVHSGQTYLVGEEGPELLHMGSGQSGSIIPNDKIGGGGGVTVNIMGGYVDDRTIAELERRLDQWRKGVR